MDITKGQFAWNREVLNRMAGELGASKPPAGTRPAGTPGDEKQTVGIFGAID